MGKYTLESKSFPPLPSFHQGSGTFSGNTHVVDPSSVNQDVNSPLKFKFASYKITVMSVEIATGEAPNWFGVSFRQGLNEPDPDHKITSDRRDDVSNKDQTVGR